MNKQEQISLINNIQDNYVYQLMMKIRNKIKNKDELYEINFGSKTGTGKSIMISKLLNNCPDLFFLITTLSRGGLNHQLSNTLAKNVNQVNYVCYGSCDLSANTKKDAEDIQAEIRSKNTNNNPIVWIRDEAHIKTNVFSAAFKKKVEIIVNISATNKDQNDIDCNFSDTLLLRHPKLYTMAHFNDALEKLVEVKKQHQRVANYNPCMVVRCLDENISKYLKKEAEARGLKCVDLNDDNVATLDICKDDSEYDVIINKMKIIEGVDIRRCHVIYVQNNIGKESTNIQLVGRSRRNSLLWRDDIDILAEENRDLLEQTLVSYIYYNNDRGLAQDGNGEFLAACCNMISIESLRPGYSITVKDGRLPNGYMVQELLGNSGSFDIAVDPETGFNYISNKPELYEDVFDNYCFRPDIPTQCGQAYIEGTNIILDKKDFMSEEFNFATGVKVCRFNGSKYHGGIDSKIIRKILPITEEEFDSGIIKGRYQLYNDFDYLANNRLFNYLSGDTFVYDTTDGKYHYTPSVTNKLGQDSKLRRYIQNKYKETLTNFTPITGTNTFNFDKKCNSCLGYLVEYFTKYQLLGVDFLIPFLDKAIAEVHSIDKIFDFDTAETSIKNKVIIRACHLKYVDMMTQCYGKTIRQLLPSLKVSDIIKENYSEWIHTIEKLSERAVNFVRDNMRYNGKTYPVLHCSGIKGIADFISEDTIIDLKTTSNITRAYLMQVLAYYELSKVRSDLHINKVIVYDCVTGRCAKIEGLDPKNHFNN